MSTKLFQRICIIAISLYSVVVAAADAVSNGASSLIITMQVVPANRPALRQELEKAGLSQFQHWKEAGVLDSYRLLFNRYADSDNWDALTLLTFSSPANLARWQEIEKTSPAGLSKKALALVSSIHTTPVTLERSKRMAEAPGNAVFLVIPYETLASGAEYLKYADGYALPQFDGWMEEGVLSHYDVFLGSFPAARPWSAMVLLEYKDEQSLARRNEVETRLRAKLKDVPEWSALSDRKKTLRAEKQIVIAEQLKLM